MDVQTDYPFQLLYHGVKTFWKTKNSIELSLVRYDDQIIEVVAFEPTLNVQAPRLYLKEDILLKKLDQDSLRRSFTFEKENCIRQHMKNNESLLMWAAQQKTLTEYIRNRIYISEYLPESKVFKVEYRCNYRSSKNTCQMGNCEILQNCPDSLTSHVLDRNIIVSCANSVNTPQSNGLEYTMMTKRSILEQCSCGCQDMTSTSVTSNASPLRFSTLFSSAKSSFSSNTEDIYSPTVRIKSLPGSIEGTPVKNAKPMVLDVDMIRSKGAKNEHDDGPTVRMADYMQFPTQDSIGHTNLPMVSSTYLSDIRKSICKMLDTCAITSRTSIYSSKVIPSG